MKPVLRLAAVGVVAAVVGLFVLPFLVASVVAGQLQEAAQVAAAWDIPPELVPALQDAGQRSGIPWFLLAAVGSVATDFARHAPDGVSRGNAAGTAIFPEVIPAIRVLGGGQGLFLADPARGGPTLGDPQDVRAAAVWLAVQLATLANGSPLAAGPLGDPVVSQFWQQLLAQAPLLIATAAPGAGGDNAPVDTPVDPGGNPIRQFGAGVLSRIGAPLTNGNLDAFAAWAAGEGTCARFNPLATTQPEAGATPFNTLGYGGHVWNYPDFATGVRATTTALTNGLYQPVIAAFRANAGVGAVASAVEQSPWGTKHFGSTGYSGARCPGGGGVGGSRTPPPTLPTITGTGSVQATIVARAVTYQAIWSQIVAVSPPPPPPPATRPSTP